MSNLQRDLSGVWGRTEVDVMANQFDENFSEKIVQVCVWRARIAQANLERVVKQGLLGTCWLQTLVVEKLKLFAG